MLGRLHKNPRAGCHHSSGIVLGTTLSSAAGDACGRVETGAGGFVLHTCAPGLCCGRTGLCSVVVRGHLEQGLSGWLSRMHLALHCNCAQQPRTAAAALWLNKHAAQLTTAWS